MAIEKTSSRLVREELRGYEINGVQLNLTMAHIYSLMALQNECKMAMELHEMSTPEYNLANQTVGVLNFIIGDIKSPFNENLWTKE